MWSQVGNRILTSQVQQGWTAFTDGSGFDEGYVVHDLVEHYRLVGVLSLKAVEELDFVPVVSHGTLGFFGLACVLDFLLG